MRYRLQRHDGTDCSATMVPITVLRMVPIQRYRHRYGGVICNAVYPCRETTLCFKRRKMFKGFQERILGQLFRILLILHDAYNQDKYLLTVFIQEVFVERSFSF